MRLKVVPAETKGSRPRLKKIGKWLIAALLVILVVILVVIPFGAKMYFQKWLVENGADTARIKWIRVNPFTGVAALYGMDIKVGGKTVLADSTIYVNIGLSNLLHHEANLEEARLADVVIDIARDESGATRIGSYTIPAASPVTKSGNDQKEQLTKNIEEAPAWIFNSGVISLENVILKYRQPDLKLDLFVESARLVGFNTDPDNSSGSLSLKGKLNGTPINLDLGTLSIIPAPEIKGKIDLSEVQLDDLADLLNQYLHPFSGKATLKGDVHFSMPVLQNLLVEYDGVIKADKSDIAGDGWATGGNITYSGKASFSMKDDIMVVDVDGDLAGSNAFYRMPDPKIGVENSTINVVGKTVVTIGEEVIVDSMASLNFGPTSYAMDFLDTSTGNTSWKGKVRVETGTETKELSVKVAGKLETETPAYSMDINGALMKTATEKLGWEGTFAYVMGIGQDSTDHIQIDSKLLGSKITFNLPEIIKISQDNLAIDGLTEISIGRDIGINYDGKLDLNTLSLGMTGMSISQKKLNWSGKAGYLLGDANQRISASGTLEGNDTSFALEKESLGLTQSDLKSQVDFTLSLAANPSFSGELSMDASGLALTRNGNAALTLDEIFMSNIKEDGNGGLEIEKIEFRNIGVPHSPDVPVTVAVPRVSLNGITSSNLKEGRMALLDVSRPQVLDTEQKTVASLERLTANDLGYSLEEGFSCDTVKIDSLSGEFTREKAQKPPAKTVEQEKSLEQPAKNQAGLPVKIKKVTTVGKNNFRFTDHSLSTSFTTLLTLDSLEIRDIDLNMPEQPFSYALKGTIDKYALVNIEGSCAPLASSFILNQETTLKNYPMQYISPYIVEAIGTYFPEGRLDFTSSLKVGDRRIDMNNNLLLKELRAETVNGELAKQLDNQLPVPLDLALTMLRDGDGNIDLDVPIEGKLSDMQIGLADLITTALTTAIGAAVKPYLAYTVLGPTGALAYIGAKVGKSLLKADLPYLDFEQGSSELPDNADKKLEKIGKYIAKEKEQTYSICARVGYNEFGKTSKAAREQNKTEVDAYGRKLFNLGEARSIAVREYLLSHFDIEAQRLLICAPYISFDDEEKPRVEIKK
jgi:hypothetical protein